MTRFDICAPIEPGIGLGGVKLRTHISELFDTVRNLSVADSSTGPHPRGKAYLQSAYHVAYEFPEGISLFFNLVNGKLYKLAAGENYQGSLFEILRVGMPFEEASSLEPRLEFDDLEEVFVIQGVGGVAIETDGLNQRITAITVYVTELDDLADSSKINAFERGAW